MQGCFMSKIQELLDAGQSAWLDYIHRGMLNSGELKDLIANDSLTGITSNPSIFEKSITSGNDYDEAIKGFLSSDPNQSMYTLFNNLAIEDIRDAADEFSSVYKSSNAKDGYVSIEVSPELAHDTEGTIKEGRELFKAINRPNIMIKVPATKAGLPAITQLIRDGINVNVTLLFAVERYREVIDAHIEGLLARKADGNSVKDIASVASFFISRVDAAIDPKLKEKNNTELLGKIAIANAQIAYIDYENAYLGERFKELSDLGAQTQRLLWASTSTKDPSYSDVLYVDSLIAPDTVNTIPPATYDAFKDHGTVAQTLKIDIESATKKVNELSTLDIDLKSITDKLEEDGIKAFQDSFSNLLAALEEKSQAIN